MYHNYYIAPGAVPTLTVRVVNPSTVTVSWSQVPEDDANGLIQLYQVSISEYERQQLRNKTINASELLETTFTGLGKSPSLPETYPEVVLIFTCSWI